jgi:hypothetical protein
MPTICHKQRAGAQWAFCPRIDPLLGGNQEQDFGLDWIGILEFVDQDVPVSLPELTAHDLVAAHEGAGVVKQVVKIEHRRGTLEGVVGHEHAVELARKHRDQIARDAAEQRPVTFVDTVE